MVFSYFRLNSAHNIFCFFIYDGLFLLSKGPIYTGLRYLRQASLKLNTLRGEITRTVLFKKS